MLAATKIRNALAVLMLGGTHAGVQHFLIVFLSNMIKIRHGFYLLSFPTQHSTRRDV